MNITDLQSLLHEQAEGVTDQGAPSRGSQIEHRIGAARRRRAAGGAALALAAVGTAAAMLLPLDGNGRLAPPVDDPGPSYPTRFAGTTLLDSVVSAPGAAEAGFATTVDTGRLFLSTTCHAQGKDTWYWLELNGEYSKSGECSPDDSLRNLGMGGTKGIAGEPGPWAGLTPEGGPFVVEMWTTRGDSGPRITDPTAVLAAGVYELPPAIGTIAGHEIYDVMGHEGVEYAVGHRAESLAGQRYFLSEQEGGSGPVLVTVMTSGFGTERGSVRVFVNGEQVAHMLGMGGTTSRLIQEQGPRTTVEVRVSKDAPDDAQIGVVWSTPID